MSRLYQASFDATALVAATAKSVLEIATPATAAIKVCAWSVTFDGTTAANTPVKVEVGRFSAAVTTATALTPYNVDSSTVASACTVKQGTTAEGAGTASAVEIYRVSPTAGLVVQYPLGQELYLGASGFFRIRLTAAQAVNATFTCLYEE